MTQREFLLVVHARMEMTDTSVRKWPKESFADKRLTDASQRALLQMMLKDGCCLFRSCEDELL